MQRFRATLEPVPHGGHFVVLPPEVEERAHLRYGARVRGTVNGAPFRSSLMKYSGVFHLGVPKASLKQAGVAGGEAVDLAVELDDQPLPTDAVPPDLARALARAPRARASFEQLSPARRRGFVKAILEARKDATRARRIARLVATLAEGVPARRTYTPGTKG